MYGTITFLLSKNHSPIYQDCNKTSSVEYSRRHTHKQILSLE